MFFENKILSIKETDRVLEIGPGSLPHPRSDVFLELQYDCDEEAQKQRGGLDKISLGKPVIYYDGGSFPFNDNEFDYVICSHVIEHVDNPDIFLNELKRIAPKGYLEYPIIYYDFLYNYNCHKNFLLKNGDTIYWTGKEDVSFNKFYELNRFFYDLKHLNHFQEMENDLKEFLFEGFEWDRNKIFSQKTQAIKDVCLDYNQINLPLKNLDIEAFPLNLFLKQFKRKPFKVISNLFKGKIGL